MPYETFDLFNTLQHLSPAAVEQCRSSPAAEFIRAYKGECRFTPLDPDYVPVKEKYLLFQADLVIDPTQPVAGVLPIIFRRKSNNERPVTES